MAEEKFGLGSEEVDTIEKAVESVYTLIHPLPDVDPKALLWAIAGNESNFGVLRHYARPEPAYMPDGYYYKKSEKLRAFYKYYGVLSACSYGTWQIMYPTAQELGYSGHPIYLQMNILSVRYVVKYINKRAIDRGALTVSDILDAYNSGSFKDDNRPEEYIEKGLKTYKKFIENPALVGFM